MEIIDFSKLTEFIHSAILKENESFGIANPSKKLIRFIDKGTMSYSKLYSKYLYRREKRKVILDEALDTMPHGFWWKLFHSKLWKQIKRLENEKAIKSVKEEVRKQIDETIKCYPMVLNPTNVPDAIEYEEDEEDDEE